MDTRPDAVVLEVSGFAHDDEPSVAALSVLAHLRARCRERNPLLIVIGEAHKICVPNPVTPLEAALTEHPAGGGDGAGGPVRPAGAHCWTA